MTILSYPEYQKLNLCPSDPRYDDIYFVRHHFSTKQRSFLPVSGGERERIERALTYSERKEFCPKTRGMEQSSTCRDEGGDERESKKRKKDDEEESFYVKVDQSLQLNTVPKFLPCREAEWEEVHGFVKAAVANKGAKKALYIR